MKYTYITQAKDEGKKLIDILAQEFQLSVRQLRRAKQSKLVRVNGHKISLNATLSIGSRVDLILEEEKNIFEPVPIKFSVVYEDEFLLVANKPPFLVVHPTKSHQNDTLGNAIAYHMRERGEEYKIRFINRLDRDTSGVVLIAKNALVQQRITDLMKEDRVKKRYLALVEGIVEDEGEINFPIGRLEKDSVLRGVTAGGKSALTRYRLVEKIGDFSLVEINLITGRTHQIRVHFKAIGHPVVGDSLYGNPSPYINRQALHCSKMNFVHPFTKEIISAVAELPDDMKAAIEVMKSFGGRAL